ncbi:MAG: DEAD/DEAH box helicase, partial [Promethearchaeota archaeon]
HPNLIQAIKESNFTQLRDVQKEAITSGIFNNVSLFICSPSGSGKTLIGEMAALQNIFKNKKKSLYLVPLRALAGEKQNYFKEKYQKYGIQVSMAVGDLEIRESELETADILIMTYEKFDSYFRTLEEHKWIDEINTIVIDEVHILGEQGRGARLESILLRLFMYLRNFQFIALSATIGNPDQIGVWFKKLSINFTYSKFKLISSDKRPVKLAYAIIPTDNKLKTIKNYTAQILGEDGKLLIFSNSRRDAEEIAGALSDLTMEYISDDESNEIREEIYNFLITMDSNMERDKKLGFDKLDKLDKMDKLDKLDKLDRYVSEFGSYDQQILLNLLQKGISFHHAGLDSEYRYLVEKLFTKGLLKVIVCTTTLSAGINTPARMIILKETIVYEKNLFYFRNEQDTNTSPKKRNRMFFKKPLNRNVVHQILGRAGRPGFDNKGYAYILCDSSSEALDIKEHYFRITGNEIHPKYDNVNSVLNNKINLMEFILLTIYEQRTISMENILKVLELSYYFEQNANSQLYRDLIMDVFYLDMTYFIKSYANKKDLIKLYKNNKVFEAELLRIETNKILGKVRDNLAGVEYQIKIIASKGIYCSCNKLYKRLPENAKKNIQDPGWNSIKLDGSTHNGNNYANKESSGDKFSFCIHELFFLMFLDDLIFNKDFELIEPPNNSKSSPVSEGTPSSNMGTIGGLGENGLDIGHESNMDINGIERENIDARMATREDILSTQKNPAKTKNNNTLHNLHKQKESKHVQFVSAADLVLNDDYDKYTIKDKNNHPPDKVTTVTTVHNNNNPDDKIHEKNAPLSLSLSLNLIPIFIAKEDAHFKDPFISVLEPGRITSYLAKLIILRVIGHAIKGETVIDFMLNNNLIQIEFENNLDELIGLEKLKGLFLDNDKSAKSISLTDSINKKKKDVQSENNGIKKIKDILEKSRQILIEDNEGIKDLKSVGVEDTDDYTGVMKNSEDVHNAHRRYNVVNSKASNNGFDEYGTENIEDNYYNALEFDENEDEIEVEDVTEIEDASEIEEEIENEDEDEDMDGNIGSINNDTPITLIDKDRFPTGPLTANNVILKCSDFGSTIIKCYIYPYTALRFIDLFEHKYYALKNEGRSQLSKTFNLNKKLKDESVIINIKERIFQDIIDIVNDLLNMEGRNVPPKSHLIVKYKIKNKDYPEILDLVNAEIKDENTSRMLYITDIKNYIDESIRILNFILEFMRIKYNYLEEFNKITPQLSESVLNSKSLKELIESDKDLVFIIFKSIENLYYELKLEIPEELISLAPLFKYMERDDINILYLNGIRDVNEFLKYEPAKLGQILQIPISTIQYIQESLTEEQEK